jgi:hypothetical protein
MASFDLMNETDVRETIVRPLLHRLGYEQGTQANIKTEQTFRYAKTFLGRKKPDKDPGIAGRADYILEVASYGRWVVEAKPPNEKIDRDAIEQAHTYAAHPEVAAIFFLVTNGRSFRLYRTSSLESPLLSWEFDETEEIFLALGNLVGPEAIKRKVKLLEPDAGKPLGKGIPSVVQIIGGFVRYEDHFASSPLLSVDIVNGLELPVTGGSVTRDETGRLWGRVNIAKAAAMFRELNELLERDDDYEFFASDEFISTDRQNPTIFVNFIDTEVSAGALISVPAVGKVPLPFGFRMTAETKATGFVEEDTFKGTMELTYEFYFSAISPALRAMLRTHVGDIPARATASGGGCFEVKLHIT